MAKRILEIVSAAPGWYARWRLGTHHTLSYPVTVWALVEDPDGSGRAVVGVDANGQFPGGADNEPEGEFIRYIHRDEGDPQPDDLFNPMKSLTETT